MTKYQTKLTTHFTQFPFTSLPQEVLTTTEQGDFIVGILMDNAMELQCFKNIQKTHQPWEVENSSPSETAYNWLTQQDKSWLDSHTDKIEKLFTKTYLSSDKSTHQKIIEKIRTLVAVTGSGLSFEFLTQWIDQRSLSKIEELDFYLLQAKIIEKTPEVSYEDWLKKVLNPNEKPYLHIVELYLKRYDASKEGIYSLLVIDEDILKKNKDRIITKSLLSEISAYASTYLTQAIYHWLNNGSDQDYAQLNKIASDLSTEWFQNLFNTTLEHPGMEQIKQKLELHREQMTNQHKQQQMLNEISLDIEKSI